MTRISDGLTKKPASLRKCFDYRKHDLNDLVIQNYEVQPTLMFADVLGARELVIRNNKIHHARACSEQPFGVILKSTVNALVEGNLFEGFRATDTGYPRGDGGCGERTSKGTRWINNIFRDNADGGIDTKGVDEFMQGNICIANYRNLRLWGNGELLNNISRDPRNAHIWLTLSAGGNWSIAGQQFLGGGKAPHLMLETGAKGRVVTVLDATIDGISVRDEKDLIIQRNGTAKLVELDVRQTPKKPVMPVVDFVLKEKLRDNDGNGFIDLGDTNRKKYGCKVLHYVGPVPGGFGYNKVS